MTTRICILRVASWVWLTLMAIIVVLERGA